MLFRSFRSSRRRTPSLSATALAVALSSGLAGCAGGAGPTTPNRTPLATKWFDRAQSSYKAGDFEDARDAAKSALQAAPQDPEIKLLNARLALARLDFDEALKLTEGMQATETHGIRGRAYWYRGDLEQKQG